MARPNRFNRQGVQALEERTTQQRTARGEITAQPAPANNRQGRRAAGDYLSTSVSGSSDFSNNIWGTHDMRSWSNLNSYFSENLISGTNINRTVGTGATSTVALGTGFGNTTRGFHTAEPARSVADEVSTFIQTLRDRTEPIHNAASPYDTIRVAPNIGVDGLFQQGNGPATPAEHATPTNRVRRESPEFRKKRLSNQKTERYRKGYHLAIAMGLPYEGRAFNYKVKPEENKGYWEVYNRTAVVIDLTTMKICEIRLPEGAAIEGDDLDGIKQLNDMLYNRVRFLWRHLGLNALRYKNKTAVHTGTAYKILSPGESWVINPAYVKAFIGDSKPELTQGEMFGEPTASYGNRTKPVGWADCYGNIFTFGIVKNNGSNFSLNNPPPATEEVSGD